MSLLADLLSKVKHQQIKKEIPPHLKDIVTGQSSHKRKIILISVFFMMAVISGISIAYLMKSFMGISDKTQVRSEKLEVRSGDTENKAQNEVSKKSQEFLGYNIQQKTQKDLKESSPETSSGVESKTSKGGSNSTVRTKETKKKETIPKLPSPHAHTENKTAPQRDAYLYSARDYKIKKDYSGALAYYKKALELDKNNFTVMNNMAYILLNLGLVNESIKYSQTAVDIKKDYVPALINLGIAYARIENIPMAETYLNRAFIIEPDNKSIILNLAVLYERQKDYQRSSEYFLKLTRLGDVTGFLGLARIYENQDKTEEALKIYKNIFSLNSIDVETQKIVGQKINLLTEKLKDKK